MLSLPAGLRRSINRHNSDRRIFYDWVEACALDADDGVSGPDIVGALLRAQIYDHSDFAWELVSDAFRMMDWRSRVLGEAYPFQRRSDVAYEVKGTWREYPAYTFCLVLSLATVFPEWAVSFGRDYTVQGELFEQLTAESLRVTLQGWSVHNTGWSRTQTRKITEVVRDVAEMLGENTGVVERWTKATANEAGLDIVVYRPFADRRVGFPVYMLQCASGADWHRKLHTPDLNVWGKIVDFAARPKKAFAMPYALSEEDFRHATNRVNGVFLDRHRLLEPGRQARDWTSQELARDLTAWTEPRLARLSAAA